MLLCELCDHLAVVLVLEDHQLGQLATSKINIQEKDRGALRFSRCLSWRVVNNFAAVGPVHDYPTLVCIAVLIEQVRVVLQGSKVLLN